LDDATPTAHPGWDVKKVSEKLDTPRKLDTGTTITERTSPIVYTARTPVADGIRATLQLQVQVPAAEGRTLAFPVLQTCEQGSTDWAQLPAEGQDGHELESPAPAFTVTAAAAQEHGADGHGEQAQEVPAEPAAATGGSGGAPAAAGWAGLAAGLLGLAAGATALLRTRRPRN
ncbi:DUF1775 domain-containing protein, partial [Arthrobacter deserti]|nr:DUF1775 domain-containing protein [Arthrobacter deserti]